MCLHILHTLYPPFWILSADCREAKLTYRELCKANSNMCKVLDTGHCLFDREDVHQGRRCLHLVCFLWAIFSWCTFLKVLKP